MEKINVKWDGEFYIATTYKYGEFKAKTLSKLLNKLAKMYKSQDM